LAADDPYLQRFYHAHKFPYGSIHYLPMWRW
jgi:hypothetical protein